jgi:prolyl oligopeptidase
MNGVSAFLLSTFMATTIPTRTEPVQETIHGVKVADPYRWLENGDSAEVRSWTEQQNRFLRQTLDAVPSRKRLVDRLWALHGIGTLEAPVPKGKGRATRYFYTRREGQQNQNVFDDFIAAAEFLVSEKITSRDRLAISGRSNGGLLVAAAITQRPDLFHAALCGVPLTDMVRYHRFRIARLWIPEYGSAEDPEQFKFLYAYSPYHHVKDGTAYPATLVFAAESDSRVDPLHARKFVARLQAAQSGPGPILLRMEGQAGHGAGKPLGKLMEQQADEMAFLFGQFGLGVP